MQQWSSRAFWGLTLENHHSKPWKVFEANSCIQIVKSPTSFIKSEKSIWWVITMYNIRIIHLRRCTITISFPICQGKQINLKASFWLKVMFTVEFSTYLKACHLLKEHMFCQISSEGFCCLPHVWQFPRRNSINSFVQFLWLAVHLLRKKKQTKKPLLK